ncbi:MAG: DUF2851 family protein [Nonlabens sp.]
MREDFLHYLWKFKHLIIPGLSTVDGRSIVIKNLGQHNYQSGPDFFNSRLVIGDQEWAGNVEMHLKSSDWYVHEHHKDPAYDNVILHVVWHHDKEVLLSSGDAIAVLEVNKIIPERTLNSYKKLFAVKAQQFINCEQQINEVDPFKRELWFEKVFFERLIAKSKRINSTLELNNNNWEAAFFQLLARSFGTRINADAFEQVARSIPYPHLFKLSRDAFQLESTLLGQSGLLAGDFEDHFYRSCCREYAFAKAKYQLSPAHTPVKLFRLRPANYPTIRLSQLAMLYQRSPRLFGEILLAQTKEEIYKLFDIQSSTYWTTHHLFDQPVAVREKRLTSNFIDLIIINCIIPFQFQHAKTMGRDNSNEILALMSSLKAEKNTIVKGFQKLVTIPTALESQAVLQLKPNYCDVNKCLSCDIGVDLLN